MTHHIQSFNRRLREALKCPPWLLKYKCVNPVILFDSFVTLFRMNERTLFSWKSIHACPASRGNEKSKYMNAMEIQGNRNEQKSALNQNIAVITDDDLSFEEGRKDEIFGMLQVIFGKTKEELQKFIADL